MIEGFKHLAPGKKLYFASDFHLGAPDAHESARREKQIISWLDSIKHDAAGIFLVGDLFDFWFEYRHTIPKGHTRFLGKLAELSDSGIRIVIFTGNHDMWMFDYFPTEFNIAVYKSAVSLEVGDCKLLVGHGDGLGPGDHLYKFYKKVFSNPLCQKLFEWLHPNVGIALAKYWSRRSRISGLKKEQHHETDWLVQYCKSMEEKEHHDFYIFGHSHVAERMNIKSDAVYVNLGEWLADPTYAVFENGQLILQPYPDATADGTPPEPADHSTPGSPGT